MGGYGEGRSKTGRVWGRKGSRLNRVIWGRKGKEWNDMGKGCKMEGNGKGMGKNRRILGRKGKEWKDIGYEEGREVL